MSQIPIAWDLPGPKPRRPRSFHVRSHVRVEEAEAGEVRAQDQEAHVLTWMRSHEGRWTPWEVAEGLGSTPPRRPLPITSVRRALTNLTKQGFLRHHPEERRVSGPYDSVSSTWEAVFRA